MLRFASSSRVDGPAVTAGSESACEVDRDDHRHEHDESDEQRGHEPHRCRERDHRCCGSRGESHDRKQVPEARGRPCRPSLRQYVVLRRSRTHRQSRGRRRRRRRTASASFPQSGEHREYRQPCREHEAADTQAAPGVDPAASQITCRQVCRAALRDGALRVGAMRVAPIAPPRSPSTCGEDDRVGVHRRTGAGASPRGYGRRRAGPGGTRDRRRSRWPRCRAGRRPTSSAPSASRARSMSS